MAQEPASSQTAAQVEPDGEKLPSGYPQFSAFLGSHSSFNIFRRFTVLRIRLMLCKQDQLSALEQQLQEVDHAEKKKWFLGNLRQDLNPDRKRLLQELDIALAEYDTLAERTVKALAREAAGERDVASIRYWLAANASIARKETKYIEKGTDMMTLQKESGDLALGTVGRLVERLLLRLPGRMTSKLRVQSAQEPRLYVFSDSLLHCMGRLILVCTLVTLLFVPVVLINTISIDNIRTRLALVWISSTIFIVALATLTKAKTSEIFVAGTTYATVLVVFLAGNGNGS